jgi:hypothetical protein
VRYNPTTTGTSLTRLYWEVSLSSNFDKLVELSTVLDLFSKIGSFFRIRNIDHLPPYEHKYSQIMCARVDICSLVNYLYSLDNKMCYCHLPPSCMLPSHHHQVSLLTRSSSITERIVSHKCNYYIKSRN